MHQPGLLLLLSAPEMAESVLAAGHLPLDAGTLERALRVAGPAAAVAERLAGGCDALVGPPPPALSALMRSLRRPVLSSAELLPHARSSAERRWSFWSDPGMLLTAMRSLDR